MKSVELYNYIDQAGRGDDLKIAVIDGQGGGIGRLIIEKLRKELGQEIYIIGLGTNAGGYFGHVKGWCQ